MLKHSTTTVSNLLDKWRIFSVIGQRLKLHLGSILMNIVLKITKHVVQKWMGFSVQSSKQSTSTKQRI